MVNRRRTSLPLKHIIHHPRRRHLHVRGTFLHQDRGCPPVDQSVPRSSWPVSRQNCSSQRRKAVFRGREVVHPRVDEGFPEVDETGLGADVIYSGVLAWMSV